jgi:hypothetical protein
MLLKVLESLNLAPDFLVFVLKAKHRHGSMPEHVPPYLEEYDPRAKAHFVLQWSSTRYDQARIRAHLARHET